VFSGTFSAVVRHGHPTPQPDDAALLMVPKYPFREGGGLQKGAGPYLLFDIAIGSSDLPRATSRG
jgi:hypothetical protein